MLETILAIAGKPGLYRLVNRGNRSLIVETIDKAKKRMPAFGTDRIISLADIAMYTDSEEVPLRQVLKNMLEKEGGKKASIDVKKASKEDLAAYVGEVLPNFDRDRVFPSDMKKLVQWYDILVENGLTDFDEALKETEGDNIDSRKA
jgi:dephospho-CoA kinase